MSGSDASPEAWAVWRASEPYSVGVEEEVMILDSADFSLATRVEDVLADIPHELVGRVTPETHSAAIEIATSPAAGCGGAARELIDLRTRLAAHLVSHGLAAACAGTHPQATWEQSRVSDAPRYRMLHASLRELARREPTFALHVHVGVESPDRAIVLANRLRVHVPLLLALSANSPYWQGRDTGLCSTRIPIFGAFPRVGIPRAFRDYDEYVAIVEPLLRCGAIPQPTFLWWDVRLQPALGTVEVRVMDAQSTASRSVVLAALVATIARLELEEGFHDERLIHATEVLDENRFLALRDGMDAAFVDPVASRRVPARALLTAILTRGRPHATDLGCADWLDGAVELAADGGAGRQRQVAIRSGVSGVAPHLTEEFGDPLSVRQLSPDARWARAHAAATSA